MQRFLISDSIPDVEFVRKIKDWRLNNIRREKLEKKNDKQLSTVDYISQGKHQV